MEKAVQRIRDMERTFDRVSAAHAAGEEMTPYFEAIRELNAYMESGQWLGDYALDEAGLLPKDIKRGVLSQDALYNLLEEMKDEETGR